MKSVWLSINDCTGGMQRLYGRVMLPIHCFLIASSPIRFSHHTQGFRVDTRVLGFFMVFEIQSNAFSLCDFITFSYHSALSFGSLSV